MNKPMHKVRHKIAPKQETLENGAAQRNTSPETAATAHQDCTIAEPKPRNAP
jgi:hypothetical protein